MTKQALAFVIAFLLVLGLVIARSFFYHKKNINSLVTFTFLETSFALVLYDINWTFKQLVPCDHTTGFFFFVLLTEESESIKTLTEQDVSLAQWSSSVGEGLGGGEELQS